MTALSARDHVDCKSGRGRSGIVAGCYFCHKIMKIGISAAKMKLHRKNCRCGGWEE